MVEPELGPTSKSSASTLSPCPALSSPPLWAQGMLYRLLSHLQHSKVKSCLRPIAFFFISELVQSLTKCKSAFLYSQYLTLNR